MYVRPATATCWDTEWPRPQQMLHTQNPAYIQET